MATIFTVREYSYLLTRCGSLAGQRAAGERVLVRTETEARSFVRAFLRDAAGEAAARSALFASGATSLAGAPRDAVSAWLVRELVRGALALYRRRWANATAPPSAPAEEHAPARTEFVREERPLLLTDAQGGTDEAMLFDGARTAWDRRTLVDEVVVVWAPMDLEAEVSAAWAPEHLEPAVSVQWTAGDFPAGEDVADEPPAAARGA